MYRNVKVSKMRQIPAMKVAREAVLQPPQPPHPGRATRGGRERAPTQHLVTKAQEQRRVPQASLRCDVQVCVCACPR